MFMFYACGLAINGYLYYRLYKSWNTTVSKGLNKIVFFHIFLNICNIVSHAGLEFSTHNTWIVLSTSFSFQTVYFLAAIEFASFVGRPVQQRLNSLLAIVTLSFVSTGLSTLFGRKYDICGAINCFENGSRLTVKDEDDAALLKSYLVHFLIPTAIIIFGSFFSGYRKWERVKATNPTTSCGVHLARVCLSCAVSIFIVYGTIIVEVLLYSTASEDKRSRHMCRVSCLYEELYLLLSMFPVGYLVYFVKQNEGRHYKQEEKNAS